MSEWFYMYGGNTMGPFPMEELEKRVPAHMLNADLLVWREGFQDWMPIGSVAELQSLIGATSASVNSNTHMRPPAPRPISGSPGTPIPAATRSSAWPWISLVLPGVAQIIYGQPGKGSILLLASMILDEYVRVGDTFALFLMFAVLVVAILDAFIVRNALRRGQSVAPWAFFPS